MANAPSKSRREVLEALSQYQRKGRIYIDDETINRMVADESDRGLIIILGSWIEDALLDRIFDEFPHMDDAQRTRVSKSGAPLRDFASRTIMAQAMGLIDDDLVAMLDVIRAMRNACAHSRQDINFQTPELKDALALLLDEQSAKELREIDDATTLAVGFISCVGYMLGVLTGLASSEAERRINVIVREAADSLAQPESSPERQTDTLLPDFRQTFDDKEH